MFFKSLSESLFQSQNLDPYGEQTAQSSPKNHRLSLKIFGFCTKTLGFCCSFDEGEVYVSHLNKKLKKTCMAWLWFVFVFWNLRIRQGDNNRKTVLSVQQEVAHVYVLLGPRSKAAYCNAKDDVNTQHFAVFPPGRKKAKQEQNQLEASH